MKSRVVIAVCSLLLVMCANQSGREQDNPNVPKHVLIVVIDACRADYLQNVALPYLQALAARGTTYRRAMAGIIVSDTPDAHVTIGTGSVPARTGIPDFNFRSAEGDLISPFNWKSIHSSRVADLVTAAGVPVLAEQVRHRLDGPVIAVSGSKHYATVAFQAGQADYAVFLNRHEMTLPSGLFECSTADPCFVDSPPGQELPDDVLMNLKTNPEIYRTSDMSAEDDDTFAGAVSAALVRRFHPALMMVNLPATDTRGHWTGGPLNPDKLAFTLLNADQQIGRILAAYQDTGLLDRTLVIVVSDHGMVPNINTIRSNPVTALINHEGAEVLLPPEGKAYRPFLWLDPPDRGQAAAEAIAQANIDNVLGVYYRQTIGDTMNYVGVAGTVVAADAGLDAAYRWLLDTAACIQGPDLVLITRENTMFGANDATVDLVTNHATVSWGAQHVPLVIAGPGIAAGQTSNTPAVLADLAPTIAALVGLPYNDYQGLPLVDAFASEPTTADVNLLATRTNELQEVQDRLIAQCEADGSEWCEL